MECKKNIDTQVRDANLKEQPSIIRAVYEHIGSERVEVYPDYPIRSLPIQNAVRMSNAFEKAEGKDFLADAMLVDMYRRDIHAVVVLRRRNEEPHVQAAYKKLGKSLDDSPIELIEVPPTIRSFDAYLARLNTITGPFELPTCHDATFGFFLCERCNEPWTSMQEGSGPSRVVTYQRTGCGLIDKAACVQKSSLTFDEMHSYLFGDDTQ